jgi:hypothetical protein
VKYRYHKVITKILVSAAVVGVAGAAPAGADPHPVGTDPNLFSTLSCNCRETPRADSQARRDEIDRGIQKGLSAWSLPAAAQPGRPGP